MAPEEFLKRITGLSCYTVCWTRGYHISETIGFSNSFRFGLVVRGLRYMSQKTDSCLASLLYFATSPFDWTMGFNWRLNFVNGFFSFMENRWRKVINASFCRCTTLFLTDACLMWTVFSPYLRPHFVTLP